MLTPTPIARVPVAKALVEVSGVNERTHCAEARSIIAKAVEQRLLLDQWRKSMLEREATAPSVRHLQNWLRVNTTPSMATLRAFAGGDLMLHLRMVMPGSKSGRAQLDRFTDLVR